MKLLKYVLLFFAVISTITACTPKVEEIKVQVSFYDVSGNLIETQDILIGDTVVPPIAPFIEGYVFVEWDQLLTNVLENMEVHPIYEEIVTQHEVTFFDLDGNLLDRIQVRHGESVEAPLAPELEGYVFIGWDQNLESVENKLDVYPMYEWVVIRYLVLFHDKDGNILKSEEIIAGQPATAPEAPIIEGFEFKGWSETFTVVASNLDVHPIYQEILIEFVVKFYDTEGTIIKTDHVLLGESATAPEPPAVEGYEFVEWNLSFSNVGEDLDIHPIYEKIRIAIIVQFFDLDGNLLLEVEAVSGDTIEAPEAPILLGYRFMGWDQNLLNVETDLSIYPIYQPAHQGTYVSFIDEFDFTEREDFSLLISQMDLSTSLKHTISNIFEGEFRDANQIHYYDSTNYRTRNSFGFEVAIDAYGIVVEKATLVSLPNGGFILSGHSSTATFIENNINIGDYLRYQSDLKEAKVYRDSTITKIIELGVLIERAVSLVDESYHRAIALDYIGMMEKINQSTDIYHGLSVQYLTSDYNLARNALLDVDFMLVEGKPIQVKSFWHYPTRASGYLERNEAEVEAFVLQIAQMGFNRVYLNTNYGGFSVYKSALLPQGLTASNSYGDYKDYLECFIDKAHQYGIEVYAWTNTLINGDGYLSSWQSIKNWQQVSFHGSSSFGGMYYYDILNPLARNFLIDVYTELASGYDLDGIEYDFIRYPGGNLYTFNNVEVISNPSAISDSGYTQSFIESFRAVHPFTGDFKTHIVNSKDFRIAWLNFKKQTLDDMVQDLSTSIRAAKSGISIAAAVMPNINTARNHYLQDWDYWIGEGWVDILDPMIYSGSNSYVVSALNSMMSVVDGRAYVVAGIFPEGDGASSSYNADQIRLISELHPVGWAKFSGRTIFASAASVHSFAFMKRSYTVLPSATKEALIIAFAQDSMEKIEYFYQYIDLDTDYQPFLEYLESIGQDVEVEQFIVYMNGFISDITDTTIRSRIENELYQLMYYLQR